MDSMPAAPHAQGLGSDAVRMLTLTTFQQIGLTMVRFGLPVLLPFVRQDLRLSVVQVAVVLTALDLGSFISFIPVGLVTDRWGERPVLVAGGLLMGGVAAATALAPSLVMLLIGLAVAGLGFPSGHTAGTKLVVRRCAPHTRGLALGIRMSGLPAGGALAALLIPSLAGVWGWRVALAVVGGLCAFVAALCLLLPRDRDAASRPRPAALAPLRELVAERRYVHLTMMGALLVVGQFTLQGFLALFLVDRYGWAPSGAGRLLAVVHVGGVVGRLLWGAISDRAARARRTPVLVWVLAGGVAVLLGLSRVPIGIHVWLAAGTAFAGGVFLAGWNALFMNLVTEHAGLARAATAVGGTLTVMFLTTMASYPIFGAVVQATGSYVPAWLLVTACHGSALLLLTRVRER
jgi:predicted MFS family arabinose efflux permease